MEKKKMNRQEVLAEIDRLEKAKKEHLKMFNGFSSYSVFTLSWIDNQIKELQQKL